MDELLTSTVQKQLSPSGASDSADLMFWSHAAAQQPPGATCTAETAFPGDANHLLCSDQQMTFRKLQDCKTQKLHVKHDLSAIPWQASHHLTCSPQVLSLTALHRLALQ